MTDRQVRAPTRAREDGDHELSPHHRPLERRRDRTPARAAATPTSPTPRPARCPAGSPWPAPPTPRAVIAAADAAAQEWGRTSLARRTQVLFAFRELLNSRRGELAEIITSEHGKVLSDALGEIARGQEVVEFACGISPPAQGRPLRERLDRRRRALQARPAGRGRHHLAVQLPGHGADVVLPDRDRCRQHRRPQAQREGPVRVAVDRAAVEGGRSPRRRLQRAPG